jgi:hypothetical protein
MARRFEYVDRSIIYGDFAPGLWWLKEDFRFRWKGVEYLIEGAPDPRYAFVWDMFSIPPFLRMLWERNQPGRNKPALAHDFGVRNRKLLGWSLMECHALFNEAMELSGEFPDWERRAYYSAVVGFNWVKPGKGDGTPPRKVRKAMGRFGAPVPAAS